MSMVLLWSCFIEFRYLQITVISSWTAPIITLIYWLQLGNEQISGLLKWKHYGIWSFCNCSPTMKRISLPPSLYTSTPFYDKVRSHSNKFKHAPICLFTVMSIDGNLPVRRASCLNPSIPCSSMVADRWSDDYPSQLLNSREQCR